MRNSPPQTPFDARRNTNANLGERMLGYRCQQAWAFIADMLETTGEGPSYGMIGNELGGMTRGEVSRIVQRLERRGLLIRRGNGRQRRIQRTSNG